MRCERAFLVAEPGRAASSVAGAALGACWLAAGSEALSACVLGGMRSGGKSTSGKPAVVSVAAVPAASPLLRASHGPIACQRLHARPFSVPYLFPSMPSPSQSVDAEGVRWIDYQEGHNPLRALV